MCACVYKGSKYAKASLTNHGMFTRVCISKTDVPIIDPPQSYPPDLPSILTNTCHGHECGIASWPPMSRCESKCEPPVLPLACLRSLVRSSLRKSFFELVNQLRLPFERTAGAVACCCDCCSVSNRASLVSRRFLKSPTYIY